MSFTSEVSAFMKTVGPFYEYVDEDDDDLTPKQIDGGKLLQSLPAPTYLNSQEVADQTEVLKHNNKDPGNIPETDYECQANGDVTRNNCIAESDEISGE